MKDSLSQTIPSLAWLLKASTALLVVFALVGTAPVAFAQGDLDELANEAGDPPAGDPPAGV